MSKIQHEIWGEDENRSFTQLNPDQVLSAIDALGLKTTGRLLALNSMENRVYEVEVDTHDHDPYDSHSSLRVVKFYRPGRWSREQILEEHEFLLDLEQEEIPAVAPLSFDGKTLFYWEPTGMWYAIFPKKGGRIPQEMTDEQLEVTGRLLARIHNVGKMKQVKHRIHLTPETYGMGSLELLLNGDFLPASLRQEYSKTVVAICEKSSPLFKGISMQRIQGDFHLGNLLWTPDGPLVLDFDDMVLGPCVQDVWPVVPGRDEESLRQRNVLLAAYDTMGEFDDSSLVLIEPLRTLRMIYFSAWIAKRWKDEAMKRVFHHFGTDTYWQEQLADLKDQLAMIPSR